MIESRKSYSKVSHVQFFGPPTIDAWCRWRWWWYTAEYKGLAIDVGRQKLYFADSADASGGMVGEISTDGTSHRVLFSDVNSTSKPRGVVIDTDNR